jgi:hypothetical protein
LNFEDAAQGFSFVAASYNRPAGETFRCRLSSVRYSISKVTHGGQPTQAASNAWSKACRDATADPFN